MELAFGDSPRERNRLGRHPSFSGWLKAGIHASESTGPAANQTRTGKVFKNSDRTALGLKPKIAPTRNQAIRGSLVKGLGPLFINLIVNFRLEKFSGHGKRYV